MTATELMPPVFVVQSAVVSSVVVEPAVAVVTVVVEAAAVVEVEAVIVVAEWGRQGQGMGLVLAGYNGQTSSEQHCIHM